MRPIQRCPTTSPPILIPKNPKVMFLCPTTSPPILIPKNPKVMFLSLLSRRLTTKKPNPLSSPPTMSRNDAALDAVFAQKHALRSRIRKSLKEMDPLARACEDDLIQRIVVESPWFKRCESLCAYLSCPSLREVDTSRIISVALSGGAQESSARWRKSLYVPHVEDRNSNMRMLKIFNVDDLVLSSMNILEPAVLDSDNNQREDVMGASNPVDLIILPGLAFDRCGRRLGRSGGYYDLFLKKYQELAKERKWTFPLLVALSYSVQILEEGTIPTTPSDVSVDALVSPAGFIPITPAASEKCNFD